VNVSEKHAVSIFRAKVTKLGSGGLVWGLMKEGIAYKPSISQLCHFSPEDRDNMFIRNFGISLRNHMAPKPKTPSH
jgi:hypothetical protein